MLLTSMQMRYQLVGFSIVIGLLFLCGGFSWADDVMPDRLKLWEIVHTQCVVGDVEGQSPAPCVAVNLVGGEKRGYAVLQDRHGVAQFLLIPTRKITGIEDPTILEDDLPPYWSVAWDARHYIFEKLGKELPASAIGLAMNSQPSRSQDQLHIHIDCMQPEIAAILNRHAKDIGSQWSLLPTPLYGQFYMVRRVAGDDLAQDSPFKQLANLGRTKDNLGLETLIVTGLGDDLIMLESRFNKAAHNPGHGEDLLDAGCAIAAATP